VKCFLANGSSSLKEKMNQHQASSISVLSAHEIDQVAGAAGLFGFVGSALHGVNVLANQFLNTPLISSVGPQFDKLGPLGVAIHKTADTGGFIVFQAIEAVATGIGGPQGPVPYHYNTEW
jgi:hypothetical protein